MAIFDYNLSRNIYINFSLNDLEYSPGLSSNEGFSNNRLCGAGRELFI